MPKLALKAKVEQKLFRPEHYEPYIKYMGSKAKILDYVISGINEVYTGGAVCDLFSGSACLAATLRNQVPFIANDIQKYSSILADAYLNAWKHPNIPTAQDLIFRAESIVNETSKVVPTDLKYDGTNTLLKFNEIDKKNQSLISKNFKHPYHLFLKNYSGTWWSSYQCLWIDALRQVADDYKGKPIYSVIIASLMHAVSYCSQGTGHFAQYRDAKTDSSLKDILVYRQRNLTDYFARKYTASCKQFPSTPPAYGNDISSLDYIERLNQNPKNTTVYADPPYCFVHYSRFYHALETLVRYDYPALQIKAGKLVKGRYREDRHQSPFCIHTQVKDAFKLLFEGIKTSKSNLVLSYSNTGMILLEELIAIAQQKMGKNYKIDVLTQDHQHMTMGRREDRSREVQECLLLISMK